MEITYLPETQPVVLVIDSDPLMLTGIAAMLHAEGYESHCAADREAALKAAAQLSLDLVICDVRLGNESGLEIFHEIRRHETNSDVPVMFMVAQQNPDVVRRAHDGGVYYLRKPFDPKVMMELVNKALWMPHLVKAKLDENSITAHGEHSVPAPGSSRVRSIEHEPRPMSQRFGATKRNSETV